MLKAAQAQLGSHLVGDAGHQVLVVGDQQDAAAPTVAVAMVVGVAIALMQALTQVQEITLTFIPKIVAILITAAVSATFIGAHIFAFTQEVYGRIEFGF